MTATYDAIVALLSDNSVISVLADPTTGVVPPIRFENDLFTKPTGDNSEALHFIGMALSGILYGQESIGEGVQADNRWDETGSLWLKVFSPVGTGASRSYQIAKLLADIFRGRTLIDGDLEFEIAFTGSGGPSDEEGNYYETPVVIDYRRWNA